MPKSAAGVIRCALEGEIREEEAPGVVYENGDASWFSTEKE